jgi:hypothetical protein
MTFSPITREIALNMRESAGPTLAWTLDTAEELEQLADNSLNVADGLRQAAQHLRNASYDRWYAGTDQTRPETNQPEETDA